MNTNYTDQEILNLLHTKPIDKIEEATAALYRRKALRKDALKMIERNIFKPLVEDKSNLYEIFEHSIQQFISLVMDKKFTEKTGINAFILTLCKSLCFDDNQLIKAIQNDTTTSQKDETWGKGQQWVTDILYRDEVFKKKTLNLIEYHLFPPFKYDKAIWNEIFVDGMATACKKIRKDGFEKRGTIRGFIYTNCMNKCKDYNKKKNSKERKITTFLEDENLENEVSLENQPDIIFESNQKIEIFKRLIHQMKEKCQTYLMKRYYQDKNNKEIAEEMSQPYNTVNNKYKKRCLKKLNELIEVDTAAKEMITNRTKSRWQKKK